MQKKYRKCVGMMILNPKNQILVGRRLDHPSGYWQMPQGGIDENENPEEAVWREMMEEIGTNNASLINSSQEWISYDIPTETLKTLPWGDKYIGQIQKWFLFRFTGIDNDINVGTENPEFSEWKWMDYNEISQNAVPSLFSNSCISFSIDVFSKELTSTTLSARTIHFSGLISAKPPETKKDLIKFLSSLYTITLPGLREDITLLCPGKIPKSPSLPGTIIVPTSSLKTRFSGETKSKEIVAIMRLQLLIF